MEKRRLINLLGAGTVTGLLMVVALLFGGGSARGETAAPESPSPAVTQVVPLESYQQLQAENDQLRQAVQSMQTPETQIQPPNGLVNDLAAQLGSSGGFDHEENEHENTGQSFFLGDD